MTFGLWQRDWIQVTYPDYPSVGNIEADFFEPWRWKTEYPHPAFEQMDAADAFWAASIAARFTDQMIKSIVEVAQSVGSGRGRVSFQRHHRRRDKVVAHWLTGTNPLDRFEATRQDGHVTVTFEHAAMRLGLANNTAKYIVNFAALDNMTGAEKMDVVAVTTSKEAFAVPASAWGPTDAAGFRYAIASVRTLQDGYPHWVRPVRITLRARGEAVEVVAVERPIQDAAINRGTY